MGSGSAPIGTPVVRQIHELDQWVGPHVAPGSHFGAYLHQSLSSPIGVGTPGRLTTATKIGVSVAAKAIESSIGQDG